MRWTKRELGEGGDRISVERTPLDGRFLTLQTDPIFQISPLTDLARRAVLADARPKGWSVRRRVEGGYEPCAVFLLLADFPYSVFRLQAGARANALPRRKLYPNLVQNPLVISTDSERVEVTSYKTRTLVVTTRRVKTLPHSHSEALWSALHGLLATPAVGSESELPPADAEALAAFG